jgi:hypothetical protein
MEKPKVYLDTTVPSAYCDERAPERQRLTVQFWAERLPNFEGVVSTIVLLEIKDAPDAVRRARLEDLIRGLAVLEFDERANALAQEYVGRGIFPEKYVSDANHVAVAVVNRIGYFASWNFRHLVRVQTRREVNLVNALRGYEPIEIVAPPEL